MAKLSITVNKVRCIGSGDCVETAPAVFQLDDEGKSEVVNATGAGLGSNLQQFTYLPTAPVSEVYVAPA